MKDETVMGGVFLGLVVIGFFVWAVSKVVAQIFHDFGIMFQAIGFAAVGFFGMAWALAQIVAVLSAAAALAYAAYRYYQLVKNFKDVNQKNLSIKCFKLLKVFPRKIN